MNVFGLTSFIALCLFVSVPLTCAGAGRWEWHRDFLKTNFDVSQYRKYWSDETWHLKSVFFDLDGDGACEVFTCTTSEEDRDGDVWRVWSGAGDGGLKRVRLVGAFDYYCGCNSFYRLSRESGRDRFLGIGMKESQRKGGRNRIVEAKTDREFHMTMAGAYCLHEIKPGVDVLFRDPDTIRIERLYPEWYFGFDFKPPEDVPHSGYTDRYPYRFPRGDLRRGGGMVAPNGFETFVDNYRQNMKAALAIMSKVTVYAVFLDVDNDEVADCYVSSSVENEGGDLRWTLFVNRNGTLVKANGSSPDKKITGHQVSVVSDKNSFCRWLRYSTSPTLVVIGADAPKDKVRTILMDLDTHSIEKLRCWSYPEQ